MLHRQPHGQTALAESGGGNGNGSARDRRISAGWPPARMTGRLARPHHVRFAGSRRWQATLRHGRTPPAAVAGFTRGGVVLLDGAHAGELCRWRAARRHGTGLTGEGDRRAAPQVSMMAAAAARQTFGGAAWQATARSARRRHGRAGRRCHSG